MAGQIRGARARPFENAGPPSSGTAGTHAGDVQAGDLLIDTTNGVLYINEGSQTTPYWTPVSGIQYPLFGVFDDFRDNVGLAVSDTSGGAIKAGSGLRMFGQGIDEIDSGVVVQAAAEGNIEARLTTTNEDLHLVAIGMSAGIMQPDQHGVLVVDVELALVSAITDRALFVGFIGTAADALDPPVTIATTVATLAQDDAAGLMYDSDAGDPDRIYGVHNKSDEAATQDLTVDGDTSTDIEVAGTYQRIRVEIDASGNMVCFKNKVQVYQNDDSLDVDEECSPVVALWANAAAVKTADVRRISAWATRV